MAVHPDALQIPERPVRPRWHTHGWNRVGYYRLAAAVATVLPRSARLAVARGIGRALARRLDRERLAVRSNLARVLPRAGEPALDRVVAETFAHFAMCFADLLALNRRPSRVLSRVVAQASGEEHLAQALAQGRGVILLTAHLGNWELAGRLLARRSRRPTHVVLATEADAALERFLRVGGPELSFVTRREATATLGLWAALRRGEVVAMQADRATGGPGDVIAPFFGAPALFPLGPFMLARAAGVPVVPAFCPMTADGRYRVLIDRPIPVRAGAEGAGLQAMIAVLERAISAHPTQWFNFYDVWGEGHGPG